jgi:uncharacterized protein YggE
MFRQFSAFPIALAFLVAPAVASGQQQEDRRPVVVTTGEGLIKTAPDRAFVTVTTETRDKDPKEAQEDNAEAMEKVRSTLRLQGIPPDAIRTISFDLHPEFDYQNNRQTLRGYVARNMVEIRVDELKRLGTLIDQTVASGANLVGGVRFDLKNRDAVERDALRMAVADARARADAAVAGAGVTIDRVIRIEEQRDMVYPAAMPRVAMMREQASDAQAETPIAPGQIEIRARVTLTALLR